MWTVLTSPPCPEANDLGVSTLIGTGLILFLITFVVNFIARKLTEKATA